MNKYLESSTIINWKISHVKSLADILSYGLIDEEQITKACFEWVRDNESI